LIIAFVCLAGLSTALPVPEALNIAPGPWGGDEWY